MGSEMCIRDRRVMRKGWFVFMPFMVLLVGLFTFNLRPETAALAAILVLFGLSLVQTYNGSRVTLKVLIGVFVSAGRAAVEIILICAIAGMIIGLVARSGLSLWAWIFFSTAWSIESSAATHCYRIGVHCDGNGATYGGSIFTTCVPSGATIGGIGIATNGGTYVCTLFWYAVYVDPSSSYCSICCS